MTKEKKTSVKKNTHKRGNIKNLTHFTSEYQPSKEARSEGVKRWWEIKRRYV